jgi:hypothetical protein
MNHNKTAGYLLVIIAAIYAATLIGQAQQQQRQPDPHATHGDGQNHSTCPMMQAADASKESAGADHNEHADSMAEMNKRGEKEMGFSQVQTTHHFRLMPDGGAIEVEVNEPKDKATRYHVRQHLSAIARAFSAGDFSMPFAVHAKVPTGVPAMKQFKSDIKYEYEETERGGRVRISTGNSEALAAVHEFLRFQIKEHQTAIRQK